MLLIYNSPILVFDKSIFPILVKAQITLFFLKKTPAKGSSLFLMVFVWSWAGWGILLYYNKNHV